MKHIHVQKNDWLIRVTFDLQDQKINKLSSDVMQELDSLLEDIKSSPKQIVSFESAKKNIFCFR